MQATFTSELAKKSKVNDMARSVSINLQYRDATVYFIKGGYYCEIGVGDVSIDADGAPNAYGPQANAHDPDGCGLDSLTAACYPPGAADPLGQEDWKDILVPDPQHPVTPYLKPDGFYISKTSLCDDSKEADIEPGKFLDAATLPYVVMPQFWVEHLGMRLGDLCILNHTTLNKPVVAIVGDLCPFTERLGEMSIAAAVLLGGQNVSPRTGVDFPVKSTLRFVLFKDSRPDPLWPLTGERLQAMLPDLITQRLEGQPLANLKSLVVVNDTQ